MAATFTSNTFAETHLNQPATQYLINSSTKVTWDGSERQASMQDTC